MVVPRRLLPPTAMLVAFEAAARTGNFTQAASELNYTQSAISRQIRSLEERLGIELFVRDRQRVILTKAGMSYARNIGEALKHIGAASLALKSGPDSMSLSLASLPTFGARWLIPRLHLFIAEYPNIQLNFSARPVPFDFNSEPFDCAIHYGPTTWTGTESMQLMGESVVPVAAPSLLAHYRLGGVADILNAPLLVLSSRVGSWERWFSMHGVCYDHEIGLLFDQFDAMSAAAKAGLGVALLPRFLISDEIASGALVPIVDHDTPSEYSYHLVWPQNRRDNPAMQLFRDWLKNQAMQQAAPCDDTLAPINLSALASKPDLSMVVQ